MGVASWLMTVCMTLLGPSTRVLVVVCGVEICPLVITLLENGSRFAPTMGLDGAVCKSGSDWYDSKSKLEVVWPSDGVEGCQEWSRRCWFKDPNYGGSPLRCEEECGGSIVFDLYVKMGKYGDDFGPRF